MQTIVSREFYSSFVTMKQNEVDLVVQGEIFLYDIRWNSSTLFQLFQLCLKI